MRLLKIISKNLKVLFRSKSSALMTIAGPLLIIILVGIAFNNNEGFQLTTGVYSVEQNTLTQSFIANLEKDNIEVRELDSQDGCIALVEEGLAHTCIVFPMDFRIENGRTNEIQIFVDNSRTNLVYQVITSLSKNIELKSEELSLGLTNTLLQMLTTTKDDINNDLLLLNNLKKSNEQSITDAGEVMDGLSKIDLSYHSVDLSDVTVYSQSILSTSKELRDKGLDVVDEAKEYAFYLSDNLSINTDGFVNDIDDLRKDLLTIYNASPAKMNRISEAVEEATESLENVEARLKSTEGDIRSNVDSIRQIKGRLESLNRDLDEVKDSMEETVTNIESIKVTDAENIVSPITTKVQPVSTQSSKLIFLFPNLLVMLIMFISLLLAGTLIIMEKSSRAFFRNFTTPAKDWKFMCGHYLTGLFVVLAQVLVIILLAFMFLKSPVFNNFVITLIILLLSMSVFIGIGMLVGYLLSTQEAVMMISISIGTVFLLLSNLILPLEDVSGFLEGVVRYNPFVVASEAIKQSILFTSSFSDMLSSFGLLFLYLVVVFGLMFLVKRFGKDRTGIGILLKKKQVHPDEGYLRLGRSKVKSKEDLLLALKRMSDGEFKQHCYVSENDFSIWLKAVQEHGLARRLKNKSRKEMISILEHDIQRKK